MTAPRREWLLELDAKIYVAGHRGLVGSALVRQLASAGHRNPLTRTRAELDLTNQAAVGRFSAEAAGLRVSRCCQGGAFPRTTPIRLTSSPRTWPYKATSSRRPGAPASNACCFLGSSCIYPRDCPQPIKRDYLLTGPLEPTNRAYALAKIAGIEMCWAYNRQHGTSIFAPCRPICSFGDQYDLANAHVLPALIRKIHEAKSKGQPEVVLWGRASPARVPL